MISASPTGPATVVDRRLTRRADLDQRAVDADDGAEQADERRGRTDGGEEGQAVDQARR